MSAWLIVDMAESDTWAPHYGSRVIAPNKRPTVLQPSRLIAEEEAKRLQRAHPDGMFVVFEAVLVSRSATVPTHVTLAGKVVSERRVAVVAEITDDDIPF